MSPERIIKNIPNLEERTFGFFFRKFETFDPQEYADLLEKPEDLMVIQAVTEKILPWNDAGVLDAKQRNPFLACNSVTFIRPLLDRVTKLDKEKGLVDLIENPYELKKKSNQSIKNFIGHDFGDGKQLRFIFCHELAKKIGAEERVKQAVENYAQAYEEYWQPHLAQKRELSGEDQYKKEQLDGYKRCLTPDYQNTMRWQLLESDWKILDMLAEIDIKRPRAYKAKYSS